MKKAKFYQHTDGEIYILALLNDDNEVGLISLQNGKYWSVPVIVDCFSTITETEFQRITDFRDKEFKAVEAQVSAVKEVSKVDALVALYKADPNCRPYDWIAGDNTISELERREFIDKALKVK